jgi:comEA protein
MIQDSRATRWLPVLVIFLGALIILSSCVKLPRRDVVSTTGDGQNTFANREAEGASLIDINTASAAELEKLPGIGPALAARIIEHRERFGRFRRIEHLIMVRGIGDRRFRKMRSLIRAG